MSRRSGFVVSASALLSCALFASCAQPSATADRDGGDAAGADLLSALPGAWTSGTAAPQRLTEVSAVAVRDQIYLLGGLSESGVSRRVEIFDAKAGTWSAGTPLPAAAPTHHLAVAVAQDQIYVLGGYLDILFSSTAATFRLDPVSGVWTRRADQPISRGAATAQRLGTLIYVAGGAKQGRPTAELYAYDPLLDSWQPRENNPLPREHLASCAHENKLLLVGGRTSEKGNLASVELYDPADDKWLAMPELPTARGGLTAATLSGRCFVFGGERLGMSPPNTYPDNQGFDFAARLWKSYAPLPTPRHGLAAVALADRVYVLLGGPEAGFNYSNTVEIFTP